MNGRLVCTLMMLGGVALSTSGRAQQTVAAEPRSAMSRWVRALLDRPVTVQLDRVSVKHAVNAIAASAGVRVQYRVAVLDAITTPVSLQATKLPLGIALERALANTNLQVLPLSSDLLTIDETDTNSVLRQGTIVGHVIDARTKAPVRGAKIGLDEADRVTESAEDGSYRLAGVTPGPHTVKIKLIGYAKVARSVTVADGSTLTVDVAFEPSATPLDQVVITGTVIPTALKAVPNAITVITAKEIEQRGITKIDQLFRGDVPGLFAQNVGSGSFLDEVTMFSRGTTALSSLSAGTSTTNDGSFLFTNPIKTYVDGVELANPKYLSQIDPKSIERIEILTGPQASTIYGSNAINGVMQIFTKRGTSNTPQLMLNLQSGWVENNFSNARTPQHDYSAQLSGVEGRLSYNAGSSWNYIGPWTPAKQMSRTDAFGGARLEFAVAPAGRMTTDLTLRTSDTRSRQHGTEFQRVTGYQETGWYRNPGVVGLSVPAIYTLAGQTFGVTLSYAPTSWWSHEFGMGQDVSQTETRYTARGYQSPSDTVLRVQQDHADRRSMRYATTARLPITSRAQLTATMGADEWQSLTSSMAVQPQTLTGSLTGSTTISRQPGHNAGGFLQTQLGIGDQLFLTYGLRLEWNPAFGEDATPNHAPRYGIAYARDLGAVTAKVRASYGRSTRPPQPKLKVAQKAGDVVNFFVPLYGNFDWYLANPELAPEHQQGGEGGLELYWATHGSLVVTRYNQTVEGLIATIRADSTRSLVPNPILFGFSCTQWMDLGLRDYCLSQDAAGFGYVPQYQDANVGSIRNQGWELQGSLNTGPFTTRGTYSWTKSRTIGVAPAYRGFFDPIRYPQYQPGATFQYLPEHTWALGSTYARAATTVGVNVTGVGRVTNMNNDFFFQRLVSNIRLTQDKWNVRNGVPYVNFNRAYALIDMTTAHRFSARLEALVQVQNLANRYTNDYYAVYATMGRQGKAGLRLLMR